MPDYKFTKHALQAMADRQISPSEVLEVVRNPEVTYRNNTGPYAGRDSLIHQRGKLYVVVAGTPDFSAYDTSHLHPCYAIITAGLRSTEQWTNADVINRHVDTKETS